MTDRIVKQVDLKAPVSRVWEALTDHVKFGEWFRVRLDQPFVPGADSTGQMTYPGYEHMPWFATVERMEPQRLFSFRWHHADGDDGSTLTDEPATLVEFRLEPLPGGAGEGTRLTITESGFEAIPDPRRLEILRGNTRGWEMQAENLKAYVDAVGT
ncbi:SRPBCC family protein [Thalassobaculum sp. OXR-137]|uniref:SRPBCC family protein n=1 Tax=Thalassobaculum sp. OXR-137 TaxID=3100173 RepID=UPI002AC9B358|nr:SRPBCC family protein [Thalassobaculum sp. OXR-137]WPZ32533.1 SRPBCC family protein [Thalassobaculum sp. OXR-137]